ncbi:LysM domain-containing protein [Frankia sp. AiPs1]|uniref:LysM peptidoglycan-binding domain-containing protein n=1 Tax=Frankia sp. AiPa1 TaxID=573492 RepID=UPI00202B7023|nr:LysM peptidoglycan-binding domain-containing protein [Frankia sp. AiPa1]MCL9760385.1 LysM peptidoglycan-binding domain-containing protein [Frankia sp. AiPa1]
MGTGRVRRALARLVGATGAVAVATLLIVFGPRAADLPSSVSAVPDWFSAAPEQGLATAVGAIAWLCLLWLCLGVLLAVAAAIPGGVGRLSAALARLILPRAMRRLVEVGLGITLVAGVGPVMAAMPAMASPAATSGAGVGVTAAAWPDLGRQTASSSGVLPAADTADPTGAGSTAAATGRMASAPIAVLPSLDRQNQSPATSPAPPAASAGVDASATRSGGTAGGGASPTLTVPGTDAPVPIIDLHETASAPATATPSESPEAVHGGAPVHTAPDPGASVPLTTARISANWPDLGRASAEPPRAAAPSTAPTGPAPAGGASAKPTPAPASGRPSTTARATPPQDPLVPSSHRGTGSPSTGAAGAGDQNQEVVVRRGDTLWTIAARHLGPDATKDQIAAEWPRWWAANSAVIGHDPNVILPGQRLTPPTGP